MTVRVVTDSAADLSDELVKELDIAVVPLTIRFGAEEFVDRQDLTPDEFYARCAASPMLPETAAPSPGRFAEAFRAAFDNDCDSVVCINISSGLSATMASAQNAAKALEARDVRIIDSRSVTWGLGSQVAAAARAAAAGASADDIVALVEDMVPRTRVFGALDTLDNLKKGGRIGNAQALIGSLLSIKPLIAVDGHDGVVEEAGRARTRSKALRGLVDKVREAGAVENLGVMHGQAPDVDDFVTMLAEVHPKDQIHIGEIGATIGVHAGPRVIGLTFQVMH